MKLELQLTEGNSLVEGHALDDHYGADDSYSLVPANNKYLDLMRMLICVDDHRKNLSFTWTFYT